jgi:hypothetical protein
VEAAESFQYALMGCTVSSLTGEADTLVVLNR